MDVDNKVLRPWFDQELAPMIDRYIAELLKAGLSPEEGEKEAFEAFKRWVNAALDEQVEERYR